MVGSDTQQHNMPAGIQQYNMPRANDTDKNIMPKQGDNVTVTELQLFTGNNI